MKTNLCTKVNFLGQDFWKLEHYKNIQTQLHYNELKSDVHKNNLVEWFSRSVATADGENCNLQY